LTTETIRKSSGPLIAVLLAGVLLVQGVQAWGTWRRESGATAFGTLAPGQLCSVLLTNGQIYYGNFAEADAGHVRLQNVYYVQTSVDPATNQAANRLVNRHKADWHAPEWMLIPADKVVLLEAVGTGSRLAELIEQDRKAGAAR
jgi:hypothetical protein